MLVFVFGFGSFFSDRKNPNDIDLLLIHESISPESAEFAIKCKYHLFKVINDIDIVMLSKQEAETSQFLEKSNAQFITILSDNDFEQNIQYLYSCLNCKSTNIHFNFN